MKIFYHIILSLLIGISIAYIGNIPFGITDGDWTRFIFYALLLSISFILIGLFFNLFKKLYDKIFSSKKIMMNNLISSLFANIFIAIPIILLLSNTVAPNFATRSFLIKKIVIRQLIFFLILSGWLSFFGIIYDKYLRHIKKWKVLRKNNIQ